MSLEHALKILVVDDEIPIAAAIAAALFRRGHDVLTAREAGEALAGDPPDVLVAELDLPDSSGLDLLSAFQRRGENPRTVFVTAAPTLEDCRRALVLGAAEFLPKPFRIEDLVRAVEDGSCPRRARNEEVLERTYPSTARDVARALRDVTAFALRSGLGPAGRARAGSAVSEILDNARRHGYANHVGPIFLRARLDGSELRITVRDEGLGFDAHGCDAFESPIRNGLARALSLVEDMKVDSALGAGTLVELTFSAMRVDFDGGGEIDLSEHDYLDPALSRRVLHALRDPATKHLFGLSPALAVVVGRLLNGPDQRVAIERALWS